MGFLRRGHVAAATAGEGHDRRHRGPASAYPAWCARWSLRGTWPPMKRLLAQAVIPARGSTKPPAPRRLPVGRRALPIVTPGWSRLRRSPGTPSSPSLSAEPSAAGSTSRRGNWPASSGRLSGTRRASQPVGPGTETPAAVTAATARTPLQITCLRRGSAPPRLQQRHQNGAWDKADIARCRRPAIVTQRDWCSRVRADRRFSAPRHGTAPHGRPDARQPVLRAQVHDCHHSMVARMTSLRHRVACLITRPRERRPRRDKCWPRAPPG